MDKGYVYIARIVDHSGRFVNGYYKIGKSTQYKVRETQLNSTHLPFDVLFVKVFETNEMSKLETILHTCFEDYRVEKKYDYRKNITTEWFEVTDSEILNLRVDKVAGLLGAKLTDIEQKIKNDATITQEDKAEVTQILRRNPPSKIIFKLFGEDLTQETGKDSYVFALSKIAEIIGWEQLDENEFTVAKSIEEFGYGYADDKMNNCSVWIGEYVIWTNYSNQDKVRKIQNLITKLNLEGFEFYLEK